MNWHDATVQIEKISLCLFSFGSSSSSNVAQVKMNLPEALNPEPQLD